MATDIIARGLGAIGKNNAFAAKMPLQLLRADAPSDDAEWTSFTGRSADMIHAFCNASTWAGVISAVSTACTTWANRRVEWAFPLATGANGSSGGNPTQDTTPAQWAAGTYDANINYCLDKMLAHNPGGYIYIRPGWEAGNLSPFPWGATTSIANARTDYIAAFQHFVTLARAKSHLFKIVWCVANENYTNAAVLMDPTNATTGFDPGAAYYDGVGIDGYLIGTDISNGTTFEHKAHTTANPLLITLDTQWGFRFLADFARTNGKFLAINEWGIGADRPDYVREMGAFVAEPSNNVRYHGIWNKNAGTQVSGQYPFPCRLSDNSNAYPLSKAAYLYYFYGKGSPVTEQAETSGLIARSTSSITASDRSAYDTLLAGLKSSGLFPYLDQLVLLCGVDNNISLINLLGAGGFTTTNPRAVGRWNINGAPTFASYKGWTGTGNIADFLRLNGANPTTAANTKMAQNDAHMGILALTANANAGAQTYECGVSSSFIGCSSAGNQWIGRPNTAATVTLSNSGQGAGHIMWNRTGAAVWNSYFNGVSSRSGVDASAAISSDDPRLCAIPSIGAGGGGVNQIAIAHYGRALPTALFNGPLVLYNLLYAFAHGVAAI